MEQSPEVLQQNMGDPQRTSPPNAASNTHPVLLRCNSIKKQGNRLALLSILSGWSSGGRLGGSDISMQSACPAVVGSRRGQWRGDSLARLGLVRSPPDGLSSVPRNSCSCSNFIPLMVLQLGICSPHLCPTLQPAPGNTQG